MRRSEIINYIIIGLIVSLVPINILLYAIDILPSHGRDLMAMLLFQCNLLLIVIRPMQIYDIWCEQRFTNIMIDGDPIRIAGLEKTWITQHEQIANAA
jgi:hypothetical protein